MQLEEKRGRRQENFFSYIVKIVSFFCFLSKKMYKKKAKKSSCRGKREQNTTIHNIQQCFLLFLLLSSRFFSLSLFLPLIFVFVFSHSCFFYIMAANYYHFFVLSLSLSPLVYDGLCFLLLVGMSPFLGLIFPPWFRYFFLLLVTFLFCS